MPCRDFQNDRYEADQSQAKVNLLTRLLCELCRHCIENQYSMPLDVKAWFDVHAETDRTRMLELLENLDFSMMSHKELSEIEEVLTKLSSL